MPPKLEQVFTLRAFLGRDDTLPLGAVKGGAHRIVVPVTGGYLSGSGLEAKILPGGGDWLLLDPSTGTAHLDIRFQARSDAGEMIYAHYPGIIKLDAEIQKFLQWSSEARTTKSNEHYFVTTPIFEVNSEKLKWMEQNVFLSHGHFVVPGDGTQAVEYEVYRVDSA
jgi:hypothetical protein